MNALPCVLPKIMNLPSWVRLTAAWYSDPAHASRAFISSLILKLLTGRVRYSTYSITLVTTRPQVSSRSSIVVLCRASGTIKPSGAIAHRLCQLIWILLHKGVRYEERGPAVCEKSKRVRTLRMIRTLRNLGYRVEPLGNPA